jgi:hypothetical protein
VSIVLALLSMFFFFFFFSLSLSLIDIGDDLRLNHFEERRDDTDQPINTKDGEN